MSCELFRSTNHYINVPSYVRIARSSKLEARSSQLIASLTPFILFWQTSNKPKPKFAAHK